MVSGYGSNSKRIVREYRESNPLVAHPETGIWARLDKAFKDSIGSDFIMELPSGRKLRYPEVRVERKAVADPDNPKKIKHRWVTTALAFDQKRNGVVRKPFYGGVLTENLVQATAREVFGEHVRTLHKQAGIDVLFTAHDEAVNEADLSVTKKDVEHIMSQCPEWIEGLPVSAEVVESSHYLK
jgi:DNA polymerase